LNVQRSGARLTRLEFFKRTVIVLAVALAPVLLWFLFDVVLIVVGAVLVAILLQLLADPFSRWARLPESAALLIAGAIIAGAIGGAGYLFGTQIGAEMKDVLRRAGEAWQAINTQLQASDFGRLMLAHIQGGSGFSIPGFISSLFSISASFLEAAVVTLIAGFYLAAQPALYREGVSKLFPHDWRAAADDTVDHIGDALRLWLIGELMQMAVIGVLTTAAVWLIGLPSPLALGVIAGIAEFIPYLGPIVAAVPAVLLASTKGTDALLYTALAYLLIHQIEGNLAVPLIQRRMVFIPPAVMLLGIVAILFVFGSVAVVFAAPIVVILYVAVEKLYIRERLGEEVTLPGEESE